MIIVLGFLALLTILAVAFAVSMRIERLASGVSLHGTRARHFAQAALARAEEAIDAYMTRPPVIYYPETNWIVSTGSEPAPVSLPDAFTAWLPTASRPPSNVLASVRWQPVTAADGTLLGRTAFLCIDLSGLLDANTAGAATARRYGTDPGEIRMLPELLPEVPDPVAFTAARSAAWKRFETPDELPFVDGVAPALAPGRLTVYSLFPTGFLDRDTGEAGQPVVIAGPVSSLQTNQTAIRAAFTAAGAGDPATATRNLLDYVDTDHVPRSYLSFCTEATPLVNEVVVTNRVEVQAGRYFNAYQLSVELWYPFAGSTNTLDYRLRTEAAYVGVGTPGLVPPPITSADAPAELPGPWTRDRFAVVSLPLPAGDWRTSPGQTNWAALADARLEVSLYVVETASGRTVDAVTNLVFRLGEGLPTTAPSGPVEVALAAAADDPRLNWDGSNPAQWRPIAAADATPSALNTGLTASMGDGSTLMYVADGPLEVVGELGFLLHAAQPWQTVALLGTNALPVLDRFTVCTNSVRRGRVNVNALDPDVLASVFADLPAERYPGEPAAPRLDVAAARALAAAVIASGPYTNLADMARLPLQRFQDALPGADAWQAEGILRNAAELLSPRQNLFLVAATAQSVNDTPAGQPFSADAVMATAHAVALVWRDPYPITDADGTPLHRMFVRLFKWTD